MGGLRSGRYGFQGKTPKRTVEQCIELDINDCNRRGCIKPGSTEAVIRCSLLGENFVNRYSIAWSHCNYGGQRPWFVCSNCGRKVGKLYKLHLRSPFWCRRCYDLTHKSSQISGDNFSQAIHKIETLKRKLKAKGWEIAAASPIPSKPKGMHWSTYFNIVEQLSSAYTEMNIASIRDWQKVAGTLERVLGKLEDK